MEAPCGSAEEACWISGIQDPQGPSSVTSGWALQLGRSTTKETEQDE